MDDPPSSHWSRREFVGGLTAAGTAGLLGIRPQLAAAEPPPETRRIRLGRLPAMCKAPQYLAGLPSHVLGTDYPPIQTASNGVELTEVRSGTPRGEGRPLHRRRDHRDRRDVSDERIAAERCDRREEPRRHGGAHVPARGETKTATVTLGTRPS
jgi:hypothetical protein